MANKVNIVFIDDEEDILDLVDIYLSRITNLKMHYFTTMDQAEQLILNESDQLSLVVCDIGFCDDEELCSDGIDFLRRIRSHGSNVPWAFCSGYSNKKEELLSDSDLNVTSFLEKPFSKKELLEFIYRHVSK
ncbi:response regulator [Halobacteriovorax sp. GB3]|uniref:response regulator n=1 Tax=Halobacteriovorax sp. GB3 TaxID=2719615 RepID=UPI002363137D|nr:response regulator [Halobacteriovorax sp. GB3]MDD0852916.1 response regulator [Halobacteriovorax sp. GB3]